MSGRVRLVAPFPPALSPPVCSDTFCRILFRDPEEISGIGPGGEAARKGHVFRRIYGVEIQRVSAASIEDDFKRQLDTEPRTQDFGLF